ncbi:M28 family peptidase [Adhaeribacter aquaticus]|uniref:M28 family peptidase n=1 Tax=Adhaeribacter aquaticus TaxID=299567 RepID=UPI00047BA4A2|nr:M28 family peptidase [Adhaeribacter aquaticus]
MKNSWTSIWATWLVVGLLYGCDFKKKETTVTEPDTQVATKEVSTAPTFNADSAYQYIAKQVSFGPRVPNSTAHRACGDYLIQKLKELGADVKVQEFEATSFDGKRLKLRNIIGSYNPKVANRIALASHWDTRPWADKDDTNPTTPPDGANDGASGVGVLLEIGRLLHTAQANPNVGVDIFFFDGEDYGDPDGGGENTWCLGSQHWAQNKHQANYGANFGILLDMVGAKNAKFAQEVYSKQFAPQTLNSVWKIANQLGYSDYFIYTENGPITDDHVFMMQGGVPTIDILDYDPTSPDGTFGKYHHRHSDNMSVIDRRTLKAVGQTVIQVIYSQLAV